MHTNTCLARRAVALFSWPLVRGSRMKKQAFYRWKCRTHGVISTDRGVGPRRGGRTRRRSRREKTGEGGARGAGRHSEHGPRRKQPAPKRRSRRGVTAVLSPCVAFGILVAGCHLVRLPRLAILEVVLVSSARLAFPPSSASALALWDSDCGSGVARPHRPATALTIICCS